MQSNQHTYSKINILKLLLVLILCITMIIPSIEPPKVYATEGSYNGEEGADTGVVGKGTIGASTTNTGFYIYIVDWTGQAVTPGVLIYNSSSGIAKKYSKIKSSSFLTKQSTGLTKAPIDLVGGESMIKGYDDAPYPVKFVNNKWESNGNEIRTWLMTKGPSGKYRFWAILQKCISEKYPPDCGYGDVWGKCEEDLKGGSYHVMVQPVAMLHVKTTYNRLMTTDGWIRELHNSYQHPLVTGAMYNCMITEFDQLGIKAPTEIKASYYGDYEKLKTTGYIKTKPHTNNFRYT